MQHTFSCSNIAGTAASALQQVKHWPVVPLQKKVHTPLLPRYKHNASKHSCWRLQTHTTHPIHTQSNLQPYHRTCSCLPAPATRSPAVEKASNEQTAAAGMTPTASCLGLVNVLPASLFICHCGRSPSHPSTLHSQLSGTTTSHIHTHTLPATATADAGALCAHYGPNTRPDSSTQPSE